MKVRKKKGMVCRRGSGCISGNRLSAENRIIGGIKKMIEVEVKIPY